MFLDPGLRKEMGDQAVALAKAVNYDSAGENSLQRSVELWLKPSAGILQVRARCRVWQSSGLRCQLWFCRWELGVEMGRTLAKAVSYDSAGEELWLKPSAMILQVRVGCRDWQSPGFGRQLWFCRWVLGIETGRALGLSHQLWFCRWELGVEPWLQLSATILQLRTQTRKLYFTRIVRFSQKPV